MKNRDFRAQRREEKRRQYELKRAKIERARAIEAEKKAKLKQAELPEEVVSIFEEFGLPMEYPHLVEREAKKIEADISPKQIEQRVDMRDAFTFTIDPKDAKDFDDALSFNEIVEEGEARYQVGVHIADVTHYVQPGDSLDKEAYERGTSVYLVDRVIPMLPEHLSNGICSLRPHEDKLTFSVLFTLDSNAQVLDYKISKTIICSNHRLTYEQAQAMLDGEDTSDTRLRYALNILNGLAQRLREKRFQQGAIAFEREEVKFEVDEEGRPLSIYFKVAQAANELIEEFMLLANRTVATHIAKKQKLPFVYRVHDLPDPEKLHTLSRFIQRFGYQLKTSSSRRETVSKNINKLLQQVQGTTEQDLIETITVRAMAKAVYTTENIGHYGLAFPYYTHFTSPIRRYPDMMVHRLLEHYLGLTPEARNERQYPVNADSLEGACQHCSQREQLAASAERASIKQKQAEFMQDKIGQTFDAVISGLTEWGIYVELIDNKCEGMIPIRYLEPRDYYNFYEDEFCIRGERTDTTFQLGDDLRVCLLSVDPLKRQMNFALVQEQE